MSTKRQGRKSKKAKERKRRERIKWWLAIAGVSVTITAIFIGIIVARHYANRSTRDAEKVVDRVEEFVDHRLSETEAHLQEYLDGLLINPDQRKVDLVKLGRAYADSGKYKEAIETFRKRLAMGAESSEETALHILIGNAFHSLGCWAEAEGAWNEAQRVAEEHDDREGLATALNNLGLLYSNTQRFEQAEKVYQEALQIRRQLAARNPEAYQPYVAIILNNLGAFYYATQQFDQAEKAYQQALQIRRLLAQKCPAAYNGYLAKILNNLARLYDSIGETACALSYRREAEDLLKTK